VDWEATAASHKTEEMCWRLKGVPLHQREKKQEKLK